MKHKKFDSDLFDLTDSPAREATKQYLSRMRVQACVEGGSLPLAYSARPSA